MESNKKQMNLVYSKITNCAISIFCCCGFVYSQNISQNTDLNNAIAAVFEDISLDSDHVHTGFLLDRAIELEDLKNYNGILTDSNYSDPAKFRNCLVTLNSARVNSVANSINGDALTNSLAKPGVVNLGVALFKYNHILENALTSNLISYHNGKVHYVYTNGIWVNPYGERRCFVFTPSLQTNTGSNVSFYLDDDYILSNESYNKLEFDAGDGHGYNEVEELPYEYNTSYSYGVKELKLRVTLNNNLVLESHSKIEILPQPSATSSYVSPDFSNTVYCTSSSGQQISARVSGISSHFGSVVKPFIYVEGFDERVLWFMSNLAEVLVSLSDSTRLGHVIETMYNDSFFDDVYNRLVGKSRGSFDFQWFYNDGLNGTIKDNYDVFYVDWSCPEASIEDNAELLIMALDWINGLKGENADRNIVIGHSMGGLIARYALRAIENDPNGKTHETKCYVSYDAPHMGVNLPLGIQYAFRDAFFAMYGNTNVEGIMTFNLYDPIFSFLMSLYTCPSARQMMYYSVDADGSLNTDYHASWQSILDGIGFPLGDPGYSIENISISNGGTLNESNPSIFEFEANLGYNSWFSNNWIKWLLVAFTCATRLDLTFTASRNAGDGGIVSTSQITYKKKFDWSADTILIRFFEHPKRVHYSPASSIGYDSIRSSILDIQCDTLLPYSNDSVRLRFLPISFVPEASSLASSEYSRDFKTSAPIPRIDTPFDSFYINKNSNDHSYLSSSYLDWINYQANNLISGPVGVAQSGDVFSFVTIPGYNHPLLNVSNSEVAFLSSGLLTIPTDTLCRINIDYCNNNGSGYLYKRRTLLSRFPNMQLTSTHLSGSQYRITADCISAQSQYQQVLDSLALLNNISFVWGYKNNNNGYVWTDTTNIRSFVCSVSQGSLVNICMKMYCNPGRESEVIGPVTVDRRGLLPFCYNPVQTVVSSNWQESYYPDITFFQIRTHQYFAVWQDSDYNGPITDTPDNLLIGNQTIQLAATYNTTVCGEAKTVYCFAFKNSTAVQSAISQALTEFNMGLPGVTLVHFYIRNGTDVLQTVDYPIIPTDYDPMTPAPNH